MYKKFFGFKERPFQLVPNPEYLFLSRSHEEALAHQSYAVSQGDGFVEITGEVGTGKTTLCRVFLENLDDNTEAAYIFNPKLDAIQLLKAINDEFGITSAPDNTKDLIDTLNFFLMEKRKKGKSIILLIDEAQNLSRDVLEQLRLLSNLETTTSKLIQIILVGQPELGDMLDSYELRQLGQRITLSCYLRPLNFGEMKDYIQHRIQIASQKPGIKFTNSAFRHIFRYSGGVPRMINIACDRALLTAYGINQKRINGNIAATSIRELAARGERRRYKYNRSKKLVAGLAITCLALLVLALYPFLKLPSPVTHVNEMRPRTPPKVEPVAKARPLPVESDPETEQPETPAGTETITPEPGPPPADTEEPPEDLPPKPVDAEEDTGSSDKEPLVVNAWGLEDFLRTMDTRNSKQAAMNIVMNLWGEDRKVHPHLAGMEDEKAFFRLAAKQTGMQIHSMETDLDMLTRLNLPAVLEMYSPVGLTPAFLVLTGMDDLGITLRGGESSEVILAESDELEYYWHGTAYVPWKNYYNFAGTIPKDASEDAVVTLKMLLRDIGYTDIDMVPQYDEATKSAVEEIQEKHAIKVDGVVGPLTKIILYNEMPNLKIPHIRYEQ